VAAIPVCSPFNQRLGKLRAVVGIGHDNHALSARLIKDQVTLIADVLAAFHEDEAGSVACDRRAEPVGPAVLPGQNLRSVSR
jgi:hypothetical protein